MSHSNTKKGNIGVVIERTLVDPDGQIINISSASTKKLKLKYPDGTTAEFTAAFSSNGSDGKIRYVTASADDLDQAGHYQAQFYYVIGSTRFDSDRFHFDVEDTIT